MTYEERKREVLKLILAIQMERLGPGKRCPLRILELGGAEVAGWFSMGHYSTAVLTDASEAVQAARSWRWLDVMTEPMEETGFDIVIEGEAVRRAPVSLKK